MAAGKFSNLKARLTGGGVELKHAIVAGAASAADIAVTGLTTTSELLSVVEHAVAANPVDRTSVSTIDAAGNLNIADDTAGNVVEVWWAQAV